MDKNNNITSSFIYFPLPNSTTQFHHETILDGEIIDNHKFASEAIRHRWTYMAFDLIAHNGVSLIQRSFSTRYGILQQDVIAPHKNYYSKLHPDQIPGLPFAVQAKLYELSYGLDKIIRAMAANHSPSTGLIFTPVRAPYTPGNNTNHLKLFRIRIIWDKDRQPHYQLHLTDRLVHKLYEDLILDQVLTQQDDKKFADDIQVMKRLWPTIQNQLTEEVLEAHIVAIRENWKGREALHSEQVATAAAVAATAAPKPLEEIEEEEEISGGYISTAPLTDMRPVQPHDAALNQHLFTLRRLESEESLLPRQTNSQSIELTPDIIASKPGPVRVEAAHASAGIQMLSNVSAKYDQRNGNGSESATSSLPPAYAPSYLPMSVHSHSTSMSLLVEAAVAGSPSVSSHLPMSLPAVGQHHRNSIDAHSNTNDGGDYDDDYDGATGEYELPDLAVGYNSAATHDSRSIRQGSVSTVSSGSGHNFQSTSDMKLLSTSALDPLLLSAVASTPTAPGVGVRRGSTIMAIDELQNADDE
eukprot:jgi/Hompol1/6725/HPOL_004485-RA